MCEMDVNIGLILLCRIALYPSRATRRIDHFCEHCQEQVERKTKTSLGPWLILTNLIKR